MPIKDIGPPSGYEGYLSRRAAALLLGFASEFKIRQLEKAGRLRAIRGVMGSAWYPRSQVLALRDAAEVGGAAAPLQGRWSDAALIAHLRTRARSVVDLVADTGISIARAERVYRFWLAHDIHPMAREARATRTQAAAERRSPDRIERDDLIRQLRDPDPTARAAAFEKLKPRREPGAGSLPAQVIVKTETSEGA